MSELTGVIKEAAVAAVEASKPFQAVTGTVVCAVPLKIQLNQRLTLDNSQLILTNAVRDYKTEISFDKPEILQAATNWNMEETQEGSKYKISFKEPVRHEITIYNALKVGETVTLLRQQGGQRYIVLDRVSARTVI